MSWLFSKVQAYLALAGGLLIALLYAFTKGRTSGVQAATTSLNRETQKVNAEFQKIDGKRPDFDVAITNLRKRATKE